MKENNKLTRIMLITVALLFVISVLVVSLYFWNFDSFPSSDQQTWGVFGDYVGGTLNPLMSVINICVSVWIAILINRVSERLSVAQQQTQVDTSMSQIRVDALKEFRSRLNQDLDLWSENLNDVKRVERCVGVVNEFYDIYGKAFELDKISAYANLLSELETSAVELKAKNTEYMDIHFRHVRDYKSTLFYQIGNTFLENKSK